MKPFHAVILAGLTSILAGCGEPKAPTPETPSTVSQENRPMPGAKPFTQEIPEPPDPQKVQQLIEEQERANRQANKP